MKCRKPEEFLHVISNVSGVQVNRFQPRRLQVFCGRDARAPLESRRSSKLRTARTMVCPLELQSGT